MGKIYRVKFVWERERFTTDEVVIAGFTFRKGQEVHLNGAEVAALRAHPQFEQFVFDISKVARAVARKKRAAVRSPGRA